MNLRNKMNISVTILDQDRRLFESGSGSKGIDPVFLLVRQNNKAHNEYDKDLHYQNSITKPKISFQMIPKNKNP